MASTEQPKDFVDIYTDILNRVRVQTGVSATTTQGKRYANIALMDMHIGWGEKLPWAERHAILVTQPEYTTGTLVATKGSTTLTGTSTLWNTNNDFSVANVRAGGKFVIDGSPEVYTVSAVASDTSLTLTSKWIDDTTTASTYVYFEDEYALDSAFLKPQDIQSFDANSEIELIGRKEFRIRYPRNKITGKPLIATIVDRSFSGSTTPVRKVRFWKPPNAAVMIPYDFVTANLAVSSSGAEQTQMSADADEPIVPLIYRHAIVFHALYHWYRDKKNDNRSQAAKQEYTSLMIRITGDQEIGSSRPQFRPRIASYARAAKRPYSGTSGRYTTGSSFDELRS